MKRAGYAHVHVHCSCRLRHRLQVCDHIGTVLLLLEARERHVRALDVLLRVLEILEEGGGGPRDARVLVGFGVLEAVNL